MVEYFLQLLVSGICVGGAYALISLGIVLINKCTGVFNFAQGDFVVVGAFLIWTCLLMIHLPPWLGILLGIALVALLGFLVERFAMRPLIGQPMLSAVMMTLALSYFLKGTVAISWGNRLVAYPPLFAGQPLRLGNILVTQELLWCFVIAIVVFGILSFIFQKTDIGLLMRAASEDHQLARSNAVRLNSIFGLSWAMGAIVAAVGGLLLGVVIGVSPGLSYLGLLAFPAVLLGGLESVPGALIGGITVGILGTMAGGYLDPLVGGGTKDAAPFLLLMLILMVRPYGLFGLKRIERV